MNKEDTKEEDFRDTISTVDESGKRVWVYPKMPKGFWTNWRSRVSWLLLTLLLSGPFLRINGNPVLQLDVLDRKFFILGKIFWPQDFFIFAVGMVTLMVFIILFTIAFGRIFCGWICPQTIFMEMVFRKIEYWIEGDWKQQKALKRAPWIRQKILKKGSKHFLFFLISFLIANVFLAYFIGSDRLLEIVTDRPDNHLGSLASLLVFTLIFYWVFSYFREQVCTTICPYGRLQGVLLDKSSIVVAYDYLRGESRGLFRKNEDRQEQKKGDCIDCHQCVDVCPTGIDIRNGTQLECVNCTACIDACNFMMEKVNLKKGLIRYASEAEIANKQPFRFTTRMLSYSSVLILLMVALTSMILLRSDVETSLLRAPGILYQEREGDRISNLYNYRIINKSNEDLPITFKLKSIEGEIQLVGQEILLQKQGKSEGALFIFIPANKLLNMKTKIQVGVYSGEREIDVLTSGFWGPARK